MKTIILGGSRTSISSNQFMDYVSLTSIIIPKTVTSIGESAFSGCSSLTTINLPDSLISIGNYAFSDCISLTTIVIPSKVTTIGISPFRNCSSLVSIVVEKGNPVYDSRNDCNAIIETFSNNLISACNKTLIPSGIKSIGKSAFSGLGLASVSIPSGVTNIYSDAFDNCTSLVAAIIPESVERIQNGSLFNGCSMLEGMVCFSSSPSVYRNLNIPDSCRVYVPNCIINSLDLSTLSFSGIFNPLLNEATTQTTITMSSFYRKGSEFILKKAVLHSRFNREDSVALKADNGSVVFTNLSPKKEYEIYVEGDFFGMNVTGPLTFRQRTFLWNFFV